MSDYAYFQMYVFHVPQPGLTTAEAKELNELEIVFEANGYRGVDMADKIDTLRAKRDGTVKEAFEQLVEAFGLHPEGEGKDYPVVDEEARLDIVDELAPKLAELGVSFEMWQDPKYEYDGTYATHFPQLGLYTGRCNSEGQPYLISSEIDRVVEKWIDEYPTGHATGLIAALNDASGRSWRDRASFERDRQQEEGSSR